MRLSKLAECMAVERLINFTDVDVTGVSADTRDLRKGEIFVAIKGCSVDGHDYIPQAESGGAVALVVDREVSSTLPAIVVADTAAAASCVAKTFYGDPTGSVVLVGITGTNGKTSTSFLLQSILHRAIGPTGIIGTVGFGTEGALRAATNTTPAAVDLYRIISDFRRRGCTAVVMEVSSHAVDQGRIAGLEFDVAVFTNITRDHLDYHETMERYVSAKEAFVATLDLPERVKAPGIFAYNRDDGAVATVADRFGGKTVSFGFAGPADIRGRELKADMKSTRFTLEADDERVDVGLSLLGRFSAYNALAAAAAARALCVPLADIKAGLETAPAVPGRFQVVSTGRGPVVVVDYAHTPDAIENLLTFCRELGPERIVTVFGCGGDRDRGKRPLMGRIACELSDIVYVTSDNPRSEDPRAIIAEILEGTGKSRTTPHVVEDRRAAIRSAVRDAGVRDMVVLAGKGHEQVQIVGERRIPFSDADEARKALKAAGVKHQG